MSVLNKQSETAYKNLIGLRDLHEFAEVVLASSGGGQQWLHLLHSGYAISRAVVGQLLVTSCIMQFGCAAATASAVIFESQQLSLTLHIL